MNKIKRLGQSIFLGFPFVSCWHYPSERCCCTTLAFEDSHRESLWLRAAGANRKPLAIALRTGPAALRKRGLLLIWLDKDISRLSAHDGSPGRRAAFTDAAIQFCLTVNPEAMDRMPRPKPESRRRYGASGHSVTASALWSPSARPQKSRCASLCSTASQHSAQPK